MALYELEGSRPILPESGRYYVADGAVLVGKVRLGDQASVWFGAVLRGDNELIDIGDRSNVQDGCVLHTDIGFPLVLAPDCTVGHRAILHGCIIGEGTLIGMGATLLNGARIGSGCIVGANALVTEGKAFPDGSLIIGSPARVVRTLSPEEITRAREAAGFYVTNQQRYRGSFRPL